MLCLRDAAWFWFCCNCHWSMSYCHSSVLVWTQLKKYSHFFIEISSLGRWLRGSLKSHCVNGCTLLLALKCVPTRSDTLGGEFAEGVNLGGQEDIIFVFSYGAVYMYSSLTYTQVHMTPCIHTQLLCCCCWYCTCVGGSLWQSVQPCIDCVCGGGGGGGSTVPCALQCDICNS